MHYNIPVSVSVDGLNFNLFIVFRQVYILEDCSFERGYKTSQMARKMSG